jgi:hypothetical protein
MSIREFNAQIRSQETSTHRADHRLTTLMGCLVQRQQGQAKDDLAGHFPYWPSF